MFYSKISFLMLSISLIMAQPLFSAQNTTTGKSRSLMVTMDADATDIYAVPLDEDQEEEIELEQMEKNAKDKDKDDATIKNNGKK